MKVKTAFRMFKDGAIIQLLPFMRDMEALIRMHFYFAAVDSGLLDAALEAKTRNELLGCLDVSQPEILDALLDVGVALGEIQSRDGKYWFGGKRAIALCGRLGDPLRAMIQGNVTYYNAVYRAAAEGMRSHNKEGFLQEIGDIVARYSRLVEPYLLDVVIDAVREFSVGRMLDVGCGTGVYLCAAANENPGLKGIGIESDPQAAGIARQVLAEGDQSDRIEIVEGDIREIGSRLEGEFSLVTFFNAVYYFTVEERLWLFKRFRELLSAGGRLIVVSSFRGQKADVASANLNMATSSMKGCTPLPTLEELNGQLQTSGFKILKTQRLVPGGSLFSVISVAA